MSWDEHIMLIATLSIGAHYKAQSGGLMLSRRESTVHCSNFGRVWTFVDNAMYFASGSAVKWQSLETQVATRPGRLYMPPSRALRSVPKESNSDDSTFCIEL